jgi:addiction module RelE/StbE family toxin
MVKKIVWSAKAQSDRREIFLYWNQRNKSTSYSRKLNYLFIDAANQIAKFPKIGKPSGYKDSSIKIVRDYLIVYKEYEDLILIITVWDGRQNPLTLKKILQ